MTDATEACADKPTALYLIYGEASVVLYVGVGLSPLVRWSSHSRRSWWRDVRRCDVQWFDTRAEAEAAEVEAIKTLRPLHNVQHNRYRDAVVRITTALTRRELENDPDLWLTVAQVATAFGLPADLVWTEVGAQRVATTVGVPATLVRCNPACVREFLARIGKAQPGLEEGGPLPLGCAVPETDDERWVLFGPPAFEPVPVNDARIAEMLGVDPGTPALRWHAITGPAGDQPFQICTSWVHPRVEHIVADHDPAEWQYRIERSGHWPLRWKEVRRGGLPSKQQAALLGMPTSMPVWQIVRQGLSGSDGEPVEVAEFVIPADRVTMVHALERVGDALEPWPE